MTNFDSEACLYCEHQKCGKCKEMDEKERTQALINAEKAKAWLIGQDEVKKSFNVGAYEKNKLEGKMRELEEKVDSVMENSNGEEERRRNSSSRKKHREED